MWREIHQLAYGIEPGALLRLAQEAAQDGRLLSVYHLDREGQQVLIGMLRRIHGGKAPEPEEFTQRAA